MYYAYYLYARKQHVFLLNIIQGDMLQTIIMALHLDQEVVFFLLIAVVGFVVYILIHRNQNKVNNYTTNSEDKPQTQSDYIKQNADYYNRIIEENERRKKESDDTIKGCIWGLILLGLFLLGFIIKNI